MTPDLLRRQDALTRTKDRYLGRPFAWGSADCIKMGRFHLRAMGHRPPPAPAYRSAVGAKRALVGTGHETIVALLDSMLPRIAPAEMLPGDILTLDGTEHFEALAICVGRKALGWHEGAEGAVFYTPLKINAAWRV